MAKMDTLFTTKMAEKPLYPLGPHYLIYGAHKRVPLGFCRTLHPCSKRFFPVSCPSNLLFLSLIGRCLFFNCKLLKHFPLPWGLKMRVIQGYSHDMWLADFNLFYGILRCKSSEWLGWSIESDLGMQFAIRHLDLAICNFAFFSLFLV